MTPRTGFAVSGHPVPSGVQSPDQGAARTLNALRPASSGPESVPVGTGSCPRLESRAFRKVVRGTLRMLGRRLGDPAEDSSMHRTQWTGLRFAPVALTLMAGSMLVGNVSAQPRIAVLNVQEAISRTAEGQKLIRELEERYRPKQEQLEASQNKVNQLREQLQKGANTMSDEAQRSLARDIQREETALQRSMEDARGEFAQEQSQLFGSVGQKIMAVIDKYAKDNDYQVVLDISNPQSPVLYAVTEVNITGAIIQAYDTANPLAASNPSN